MYIKGLQKLTLLDYPNNCACTVFTFGCNLRCPFCHNGSLVVSKDDYRVTEGEFFDFLLSRRGLLDGVAITGGEPLLQPDLEDFIIKIKNLGFLVKLDTNGTFPDRLKDLIDKKLVDYVAMDVKNSLAKYPQTVGVRDFDVAPIIKSINILKQGNVDYEFRTTVSNELFSKADFEDIALLLKGAEKYYIQAYKDSPDILNGSFTTPKTADLQVYAQIVKKSVKTVDLRGV